MIYSLLWHFLNSNDITKLEQEEIMRQYSLNDAKPSRVPASLTNKYSFEEVNNNKADLLTTFIFSRRGSQRPSHQNPVRMRYLRMNNVS